MTRPRRCPRSALLLRLSLLGGVVFLGLGPRVGAQAIAKVEIGTALLRQGGIPQSTVLTAGSELGWTGERAAVAASAISARAPDDRWTGQALVGASIYAGPATARWELGASFGAFGESNATPSSSAQLVARRHVRVGAATDLFVGVGAGATGRYGRWQPAALGQAGMSAPFARGVLTAALAYSDVRRELRVSVPDYGIYDEISRLRFGDVLAFWERSAGAFDVTAGGGARFTGGARIPTPWASASAAWWVTPRFAVVASAGRALEDMVRAVPETRYASLAIRVPIGAAPRQRAIAEPNDDQPRLFIERPDVTAASSDSRVRVLAVRIRHATSVELMGDFTGWEPLSLSARDGAWAAECTITPGTHRVAVRVNGGDWQVPANLPPVADDFGGTVGLLTVP